MSDYEECPHCDHGFTAGAPVEQRYPAADGSAIVAVAKTLKPCEVCHADAFEEWQKRERIRRRTVPMVERTFEANPQAGLASVRDALAKADEEES